MADRRMGDQRFGAGSVPWLAVSGSVTLAAAWWLRAQGIGYLAVMASATALALVLAARMSRASRRWPMTWAALAAVFLVTAALGEYDRWRLAQRWPAVAAERARRAEALFATELAGTMEGLAVDARNALRLPADPAIAMRALRLSPGGTGEVGIVVFEDNAPLAWGGRVRTMVVPGSIAAAGDTAPDVAIATTRTPFYLTLEAIAAGNGRVARATTVVDARPPADRLATSLAELVSRRSGIAGFDVSAADDTLAGSFAYPAEGAVIRARARPEVPEQVRLAQRIKAVERGAALLALMLLALVVSVWRDTRSRLRRLAALALTLAAVALTPLSVLSPHGALFSPAFYYASLGGPFTATAASFGLTAAVTLLALLTVLRHRRAVPRRAPAAFIVLVVAGLGPFLLRDLARGVNPPESGVTIPLWLSWEIPLFLAAVSVLLAGATAGRAALGGARGLHPAIAPTLAVAAAILGPIVWMAPARWPGWYPVPWIAAMGALALTRRTRAIVLTAAVVAACGAATLVWGAVNRKWVALAEAEISRLNRSDETMYELAGRFAARLDEGPPPATEAELLSAYVSSALAAGGYAVDLAAWQPDGTLGAELLRGPEDPWPPEMAEAVTAARAGGEAVVREGRGQASRVVVAAVPHANGWVTGVVVAPRTRLDVEEPALILLGLAEPRVVTSPYTIALTGARDAAGGSGQWRRTESEMHSDWRVTGGAAPQLAHVIIELRPLDGLIQRGTLAVLLDLAIVGLLWALSAIADGGYARWLRSRWRRWSRSYRSRLTLVLFGFFVVPALAFALWSWRRLRLEDVQSRSLLAGETLRRVTAIPELARARGGAREPVLVYRDGMLSEASNPVYTDLAPTGALLTPEVHLALDVGDEVAASRVERLGESRVLMAYRAATAPSTGPAVYATPAPTNEAAVEQRRRDLGILVLFATAVGGLAALWLSGVAARQLAEPVGRLRRAALAIAAGTREPALAGQPTVEFEPVFSAFRRMTADLAQSRAALEEAQRRTAAILRNVASGVIAVRPDLTVALANPRADALLGHPLPPDTRLDSVLPPPLLASLREFLAGTSDEEPFDLPIEERQMRGRLTRLGPGGVAAVLTIDDVTDLSRAQRVLAWGEMARQVAHEIKNPLTPIRLGVQHLQRARTDSRIDFDHVFEQNVDRILREIDRLDEIARTFSRYGAPAPERAVAEPTDVASVVRDAIGLERMGEGGVRWSASGADEPVLALARRDELREVLLNLLENARLANAGAVDVAVAADGDRVRITVEDDGDGIEAEAIPRIFDPQFSTRTSGSGLGLAVSRRIIESWGGRISVRSEVGQGTTVTLALRRREPGGREG